MVTENKILERLDNYKLGFYCQFVSLGHGYSYLIDSRLNVFKGNDSKWAIVSERLGYNPRAGGITLDICYFGNCVMNLENYNAQDINYYSVFPIEWESFNNTVDKERLKEEAQFWTIRDKQIALSHNKQEYYDAGIELKEYEPGEISVEEVGRLLVTRHRDLLRATDQELYKSIPHDLNKILVIDGWYRKDFIEIVQPEISDENLRTTYELNKQLSSEHEYMDYESFSALFRQQEQANSSFNQGQWQDNRPSSYETWQLLAKVIVTGDTTLYKPTLEPNTHWKNWPDSGSL